MMILEADAAAKRCHKPDEEEFTERWAPRQPATPPRGMTLGLVLFTPVWVALGGLLYSLAR